MTSHGYTSFIKNLINNPKLLDALPQKVVFFDYDNIDVWTHLFTPKRMELLKIIHLKNPRSITELANLTNRKKENVHRDLELLQDYSLVKIKKHNHRAEPKVVKNAVIISFE